MGRNKPKVNLREKRCTRRITLDLGSSGGLKIVTVNHRSGLLYDVASS